MRRLPVLKLAAPALVLGSAALLFAAQTSGPLAAWVAKVNGLKSLKADIVLTTPGMGSETSRVLLQKPASLKVDDAGQTVVADGTTVTVLDKERNVWYTRPQKDVPLGSILKPDQYALVRAFFDAKAFDGAVAKAGEPRSLGGETVKPVDVALDAKGKKTMTIFIGGDGLSRKAERRLVTPDGKKSAVVTAKTFETDAMIPDSEFAFRAPDSAKEISFADLMSSKWFTDLDEAKAVAAASGKKIFVDFYATWCGPCKRLEAEVFSTPEFKALSSKFVFCRIDVDLQPLVAQQYNIEAMPTQAVTDENGKEIGRTVGYANPQAFFEFINGFATQTR